LLSGATASVFKVPDVGDLAAAVTTTCESSTSPAPRNVVLTIFVSAVVALLQTILRFIHPHTLTHLWWLAAAGVIGFVGNEIAAQIWARAGERLNSPALVADGNHARVDGFVSLGVLASAAVVALGLPIADPIIGLIITLVILRITWDSWHTVREVPAAG
jgi:cation diffusion facilitator family transporter